MGGEEAGIEAVIEAIMGIVPLPFVGDRPRRD